MVNRACVFVFLFIVTAGVSTHAESPPPHPRAHAHNDYRHERPLLDALDQGFCSVEADVFLIDGKLLVAHSLPELSPERTLESLYLNPLRDRVKANGGSVHGKDLPFTLLIDIKSDGEATYRALSRLLSQYDEMLTHVVDGRLEKRAVTAIISGERAVDVIANDSPRYVGIDGRLSDLDTEMPSHLMPLISDHWGRHFRWRGVGDPDADDLAKLQRIVKQAHAKKRRVRFWAIPDKPAVWAALNDAGVDLINTDNLSGLSEFLRAAD